MFRDVLLIWSELRDATTGTRMAYSRLTLAGHERYSRLTTMRQQKAASRAALLLGLVTVAASAEEQPSADPLEPFGWFKDMAGYCWSGMHPDGKTTDTQCYSVQFGRILRGTIKLSGTSDDNKPVNFEGDSVYVWNPKIDRVQYTLWANDGTYGTGEMLVIGDHLVFPPANADTPGATRLVWQRVDANSFIVMRERRQQGTWSKVFEVTYRRSGAAPTTR